MTERYDSDAAATSEAAEWIDWNGESADGPLDSETVVVVRVRDGFVHQPFTVGWWAGNRQPHYSNWYHQKSISDIVAYRVVAA